MGFRVGVVQSIGIDETNTSQLKFFTKHENCGRYRLGRLVGVRVGVAHSRNKLALRTRLRNLNPNSLYLILSEITAFILTIF